MDRHGYAVIGFTATGLDPSIGARLQEISVVQLDINGVFERTWTRSLTTLCPAGAPQDDIVDHLDLVGDPVFSQVAGALAALLAGRTLVAHHAETVLQFLAAEFAAVGLGLPALGSPLSTQQLSRTRWPDAPRSLVGCVDVFALAVGATTGAAWDAEATARLLVLCRDPSAGPAAAKPQTPVGRTPLFEPGRHGGQADNDFLAALVAGLPPLDGSDELVTYLILVDRCLLGRYFDDQDSNGLVLVAERLGINRFRCESIHREYFGDLVDGALALGAGILHHHQVDDLKRVGYLLDLPMSVIAQILVAGSAHPVDAPAPELADPASPPFPVTPQVRSGSERALPRHLARIARLLVR